MNPGDEALSEPFTRLPLRRRRSRKQQPNSKEAAARIPSGIPTPMPIFCFFVSPPLSAAGASGSEVEDVEDDVEADVGDNVESEVESDVGDDVEDGVEDGVGVEEAPDDALDSTDELTPDVSTELSVVDADISALAVGEEVSHAVDGPNSLIK